MASLTSRCLHPDPETTEYPVAASQFFYHNGVNAVFLNSSGHLELALTATATILGIAIVPKGRGAGTSDDYWKSSATAGADKIPVILATSGYKFLLPGNITATAAMRGGAWDLIAVNDGTATTLDLDTSTTDVFIVDDLGVNVVAGAAVTDVVARINPLKVQADT
jgi:hypothetical protein